MRVGPRTIVTLDFDLYDADEQDLLESTKEMDGPLEFFYGLGDIEPGLEKALRGKTTGDAFDVTLEPEDAYGYYDETLTDEIPLEEFPPDVEEGDEFQTFDNEEEADAAERGEVEGDPQVMTVVEIDRRNGMVKVDYNHRFAGLRLRYKGTITDVREPANEEEQAVFDSFEESLKDMAREMEKLAPEERDVLRETMRDILGMEAPSASASGKGGKKGGKR